MDTYQNDVTILVGEDEHSASAVLESDSGERTVGAASRAPPVGRDPGAAVCAPTMPQKRDGPP